MQCTPSSASGRHALLNVFISMKKLSEGDPGRAAAAVLTWDWAKNVFVFDEDINVATLLQLLENVEGVERVDELLLFEYDVRNGCRVGFAGLPTETRMRPGPPELVSRIPWIVSACANCLPRGK